MKLVTIRSQIREVADLWNAQYPDLPSTGKHYIAIGKALKLLDPETATAKDVAAIIGNTTWVCPTQCYECGYHFDRVIEFSSERECNTFHLCFVCITKAFCALEVS